MGQGFSFGFTFAGIKSGRVSLDWQSVYNHHVLLVETFVDTERFQGTCYKADNWIYVGKTTGRGKLSKSTKPTLSKKAVYVYPLTKNFRHRLTASQRRQGSVKRSGYQQHQESR